MSDETSIVRKFLEERPSKRETTWAIEGKKEAPRVYIRLILEGIFTNAMYIEDLADKQIPGIDWNVCFTTGSIIEIDDKTDLSLGYTGNIFLDHDTLMKRECGQLFVNPNFQGKYLVIYNERLPPSYVIKNSFTTTMRETKTEYGSYETKGYAIEIKKIKFAIAFAKPSINWFTKKRRRPDKNTLWAKSEADSQ